ncbi:MAG: hydroxyethylthiazole kinase [Atopobiaceae bacterium]
MNIEELGACLDNVRKASPLVHCITNYVTVNDCANAVLAIGASPIMSDEPDDVEDITSICNGLDLNIGTLNHRSIDGMDHAAAKAASLGHAIVLDPVGAGASKLRTETARHLLDTYHPQLVRGNMSEIRALGGASASTRGVDVSAADAANEDNLSEAAAFVAGLAKAWKCTVAVTGAIDIVSDGTRTCAIRNGVPMMGRITGTGCMLSAMLPAFLAANDDVYAASVAGISMMGICGEKARARMAGEDGTGSFRTYLIDALSNIQGKDLVAAAKVADL